MTDLILFPTATERDTVESELQTPDNARVELCGFGLAAAGVRTAHLLATYQPRRVVLIGIAGAIGPSLAIGSATAFSQVACWGIGAGEASLHQTATDMGWLHYDTIGDVIDLGQQQGPGTTLLTVAAASANAEDATRRAARFPTAVAEDMEGFAVALACTLADTPLTIVRGISNRAGDRDKANWQVPAALQSAAQLAAGLL